MQCRAYLEVLVLGQHCDLVAVDANHSSLQMNQLTLTHFHHVTRRQVVTHLRLRLCSHCIICHHTHTHTPI